MNWKIMDKLVIGVFGLCVVVIVVILVGLFLYILIYGVFEIILYFFMLKLSVIVFGGGIWD